MNFAPIPTNGIAARDVMVGGGVIKAARFTIKRILSTPPSLPSPLPSHVINHVALFPSSGKTFLQLVVVYQFLRSGTR